MPRFYKPITLSDFKSKLEIVARAYHENTDSAWGYGHGSTPFPDNWIEETCWMDVTETVINDLDKVEFDGENYTCGEYFGHSHKDILGLKTLPNGMPYLGCYAGGDWEEPVFFILYWDGNKVRGYVPKEGNVYNTKTNKAWGNDDDDDMEIDRDLDKNLLRQDIQKRIIAKPL